MPTGTLHVFSRTRTVPKKLALDGRFTLEHHTHRDTWPRQSDWYITFLALCAQTERAAGRMGAQVVVLPEAQDYLQGKIMVALASGRDVWAFVAARAGDEP